MGGEGGGATPGLGAASQEAPSPAPRPPRRLGRPEHRAAEVAQAGAQQGPGPLGPGPGTGGLPAVGRGPPACQQEVWLPSLSGGLFGLEGGPGARPSPTHLMQTPLGLKTPSSPRSAWKTTLGGTPKGERGVAHAEPSPTPSPEDPSPVPFSPR